MTQILSEMLCHLMHTYISITFHFLTTAQTCILTANKENEMKGTCNTFLKISKAKLRQDS